MTCPQGKLGSSFLSPDVKTDGTGQYDHWRISPVEVKTDTYMIACRFRETAAFSYLYWCELSQRLVKSAIMPGFDYDYGHWILVSKNDYEKQVITLDEQAVEYTQPIVTASDGATVRLKRTLTLNSWNTLCLPFDINEAQLRSAFGEDMKLAEYINHDETTLYFKTVSSEGEGSGHLYLIYPTKAQSAGGYYEFTGITGFAAEQPTTTGTDVTAYPSYTQTTAPAGAYVIRKNVVYHLTSDMTMKGFRFYFVENEANAGKLSKWTLDGIATDINQIDGATAESDAPIYNMAGQRVSNTTAKGVYLKNGKKIVKK